ncbi:PREDICTED: uncharacterized protein LOC108769249 [Trachymyrmex cornetzi]|uniref:uncharacterized protein LOC108766730 n=1 Tax=Trachymyrmex cornetzi TaxID=471704 RepID=UPI00084F39F6|nr:PREDICTED: uncharacterized protein LOC108766730 [Trachymyrmex cornetzi]XP_018375626.1 PREDICTED: uncharacterized protein LOC108769249 [Trachymyrmex cornetzi]
MVSSCCICSKENFPSEPHRSFHRIPANEEMRNKWLQIIGRNLSYKGARVCSDHFTENDYHDINPCAKIKRLKNTAVPSVTLQKKKNTKGTYLNTDVNVYNSYGIMFQDENDITLHNSENHETNASNCNIDTKESENISNELELTQNTSEDLIIFLNSEQEMNATCINNQEKIDVYFENDINDMNREREVPSPNLGNYKIKEKILKSSKHTTERFTKTDFLSEEKWTAFLKCITYNKRVNRLMRQRNKCLQKKIMIFQDMLQDLLKKV